jgi:hypothetical protein
MQDDERVECIIELNFCRYANPIYSEDRIIHSFVFLKEDIMPSIAILLLSKRGVHCNS